MGGRGMEGRRSNNLDLQYFPPRELSIWISSRNVFYFNNFLVIFVMSNIQDIVLSRQFTRSFPSIIILRHDFLLISSVSSTNCQAQNAKQDWGRQTQYGRWHVLLQFFFDCFLRGFKDPGDPKILYGRLLMWTNWGHLTSPIIRNGIVQESM